MVTCCSINMRIFRKIEFSILLLSIVCSCNAAPEASQNGISSPIEPPAPTDLGVFSEPGDRYDQRQNGTENYRIHVDGLVVVVAPVEALLLAGGIPGAGGSDIFGIQQGGSSEKPSKPEEPVESKPKPDADLEIIKDKPLAGAKSSQRPGLRLMSLLSPFLRKVHARQ